jgi:hypothetical protein
MMAVPTPPKELKLGRVLAAVVAALVTAELTVDGVTPAIGLPLPVGVTGGVAVGVGTLGIGIADVRPVTPKAAGVN